MTPFMQMSMVEALTWLMRMGKVGSAVPCPVVTTDVRFPVRGWCHLFGKAARSKPPQLPNFSEVLEC